MNNDIENEQDYYDLLLKHNNRLKNYFTILYQKNYFKILLHNFFKYVYKQNNENLENFINTSKLLNDGDDLNIEYEQFKIFFYFFSEIPFKDTNNLYLNIKEEKQTRIFYVITNLFIESENQTEEFINSITILFNAFKKSINLCYLDFKNFYNYFSIYYHNGIKEETFNKFIIILKLMYNPDINIDNNYFIINSNNITNDFSILSEEHNIFNIKLFKINPVSLERSLFIGFNFEIYNNFEEETVLFSFTTQIQNISKCFYQIKMKNQKIIYSKTNLEENNKFRDIYSIDYLSKLKQHKIILLIIGGVYDFIENYSIINDYIIIKVNYLNINRDDKSKPFIINNINLFENFFGTVSSIFGFYFLYNEQKFKQFIEYFYKNKFTYENLDLIFQNYEKSFESNLNIEKKFIFEYFFFNPNLELMNYSLNLHNKNLLFIQDKYNNEYILFPKNILTKNNFTNFYENIYYYGGFLPFVPIFKILFNNINFKNHKLYFNNIIEIIQKLINYSKSNLILYNKQKIYDILILFLEKSEKYINLEDYCNSLNILISPLKDTKNLNKIEIKMILIKDNKNSFLIKNNIIFKLLQNSYDIINNLKDFNESKNNKDLINILSFIYFIQNSTIKNDIFNTFNINIKKLENDYIFNYFVQIIKNSDKYINNIYDNFNYIEFWIIYIFFSYLLKYKEQYIDILKLNDNVKNIFDKKCELFLQFIAYFLNKYDVEKKIINDLSINFYSDTISEKEIFNFIINFIDDYPYCNNELIRILWLILCYENNYKKIYYNNLIFFLNKIIEKHNEFFLNYYKTNRIKEYFKSINKNLILLLFCPIPLKNISINFKNIFDIINYKFFYNKILEPKKKQHIIEQYYIFLLSFKPIIKNDLILKNISNHLDLCLNLIKDYKNFDILNFKKEIDNKLNLEINDLNNNIKKNNNIIISKTNYIFDIKLKNSFLVEKYYKKIIKNLFTFEGLWENKFLLSKYNIKQKVLNYITANFKKPLLTPMIDFSYYFPNFVYFENFQQFFKNDDKKNNLLNIKYFSFIDEIQDNIINKEKNEELNHICNEIYNIIERDEINNSIKFYCCLIKLTHHIHGYLEIIDDKIKFYSINNEENNIKYCTRKNTIRKNCYGSVFTNLKRENFIKIEINVNNIELFFYKNYYYKENAIEIYDNKGKNYIFNILSDYKDKFFKLFENSFIHNFEPLLNDEQKNKKILGYINKNINKFKNIFNNSLKNKKGKYKIKQLIKNWMNYKISNYSFLMVINIFSNRSFSDIYQYPVFPIILYPSSLWKNNVYFRDLKNCIGQLNVDNLSESRITQFEKSYNLLKSDYETNEKENIIPYYYSTNFSNPVYVSNYLIRIFPFTFLEMQLQGGKEFDTYNRLFNSIEKTLINCLQQKSDVRELIPEFFYLPEMLININNIKFDSKDENKNDDVEINLLPFENSIFSNKYKLENNDIIKTNNNIKQNSQNIINNNLKNNKDNLKKTKKNKDLIIDENYMDSDEEDDDNNKVNKISENSDNIYLDMLTSNQISNINNQSMFLNKFIYIYHFSCIFEDNYVSKHLNKWIDLIFGISQKNEKKKNIFRAESYLDFKINEDNMEFLYDSYEFGMNPKKIFTKKLKKKKEKQDEIFEKKFTLILGFKNYQLLNLSEIKNFFDKLNKNFIVINLYNYNYQIINNELTIIFHYNNNEIKILKYYIFQKNYSFSPKYFNKINYNQNFVLSSNFNYSFLCGFNDGLLLYFDYSQSKINCIEIDNLNLYKISAIEVIEFDKNYLIIGDIYGCVKIINFEFIENKVNFDFKKIKILNDNYNEITFIKYNKILNMFIVSSIDGYLFLYTFPKIKKIRSIFINSNIIFCNIFSQNIPIILAATKKRIYCYSINGEIIENDIFKSLNNLSNPIFIYNYFGRDILICLQNNIKIIKIDFPEIKTLFIFNQKFYSISYNDKYNEIFGINEEGDFKFYY